MIGLIVLAIGTGWLGLSIWAARAISQKVRASASTRFLVALTLATLFFLAPVADELIARPKFERLCQSAPLLTIDSNRIQGRTVNVKVEAANEVVNTLPIRIFHSRFTYRDSMTAEVLGTYEVFEGEGGLLARVIGTEGTHPLTGAYFCAPERGSAVAERYKFVLIH